MNKTFIDIHHHGPLRADAINAIFAQNELPEGNFSFSVGFHPWHTSTGSTPNLNLLAEKLSDPRVVAVGEIGIDSLKGADINTQMSVFSQQLKLAIKFQKPVIIHNVRSTQLIEQIITYYYNKEKNKLSFPPIIYHGFRGKPQLALSLAQKGRLFSFGEKFNIETAKAIPSNILFCETDESNLPISDIINNVAKTRNNSFENILEQLVCNINATF